MPANRSRTYRWRDSLEQVRARNGTLELAIDTGDQPDAAPGKSLIWRVRVLDVTDESITVETPRAFGESMRFEPGTTIIVAMTIGQNRWMFRTQMIERDERFPDAAKLSSPSKVERCSRRSFYRVATAHFNPAPVEVWPLLDPASVVSAEVANRAMIQQSISAQTSVESDDLDTPYILPEVGPKFSATLVNVGGGGAGLLVDREQAGSIEQSRLFWTRIDLTPQIPAPLGITARVVHTHLDSSQNVYAGMNFDFAYNPSHKDFVIEQISRYTKLIQRAGDFKQAG